MPFVEFCRDRNELWNNYWIALWAICILTPLCMYVVSCDDLFCAVIIIQLLLIVYCVAWSIMMWKMLELSRKKKMEEEYTE
jgi:hypothetical protein